MEIVSFLPSATEIVFALGLGDKLVGVTDKCRYPPEAQTKPIVVTSALNTDGLTGADIDAAVRLFLAQGGALYQVNVELLRLIQPDIIVAQGLCEVCAASDPAVETALRVVPDAQVIWLNPTTLDEVLNDIVRVAEALGVKERGERLKVQLQERLETVKRKTQGIEARPRVWVAEWVDPPFCCGHWVPQMVDIAGGSEGLGKSGQPSRRILWDEVVAWQPEVIVLAPCGRSVEQTLRDAETLKRMPQWNELPAVQTGRVYAVDGDLFTCPGLRLVDGVEVLARLLHPTLFPDAPAIFAKGLVKSACATRV
ncbi:Vitamin B12-binding protein [bacterium HR17]|uniref:Vitamin B12-binding protein n=1 Tax=Candidatus Fervidibacter japonicus TaxID=2035412 RepID=A0A2H5XFL3_9BACT|nr:Vitamin B12-binding protein [bacterium HR17]